MLKCKTIFISALDWGLGHATRCIPLIKQLQSENKIILGTTPLTALIFNEEFPELEKVMVEPYKITYSKRLPIWLKLAIDSFRILSVIRKEKQQLIKIIQEYGVNVVISDNRFGLNNSKAHCIYMTHQLHVQAGVLSGLANWIHRHYMKRFNEIWVPDFEKDEEALAGKLSRKTVGIKVSYLGPLSRLKLIEKDRETYDYLCILSGPEPLRTEFENLLMRCAVNSEKRICMVRGTRSLIDNVPPSNVHVCDLPDAEKLSKLIVSSNTIVCRSGYSTLMDLKCLGNMNCILVPTPGQNEQEYLAEYWQKNFNVKVLKQSELDTFTF